MYWFHIFILKFRKIKYINENNINAYNRFYKNKDILF